MVYLVRYLVWILVSLLLTLRYRVRVRGAEILRRLSGHRGPVLVLPNHPALVDPTLVMTLLWPTLRPRPMLFEGNFRSPLLRPIMGLLDAVKVPDLQQASADARSRAEDALGEVIRGLKRGERHLLWPSGRLRRGNLERLGGARALADILAAVPEAEVVVIRTRGLWGSTFSYAYTGESPPMGRRAIEGLGWLVANAVFFMPRRTVDITIERVDRTRLPEPKRELINPWFEAWYNAPGPEQPVFVPYHASFGPRTREFPPPRGFGEFDPTRIKPAVAAEVSHLIADKIGRPLTDAERHPDATLDQLGLDSLERMELMLVVEQHFGFTGDEPPATVGQLLALAGGLVERRPPQPPPAAWFRPPDPAARVEVLGETLAEACVNRALRGRSAVMLADDLAGVLTAEQFLTGAVALAGQFRRLPGENVGLLLPASVACDMAFLGLHLAGKVPVMMNWTTGPANLAHAARVMNLSHVVSSRAFIDRTGVAVDGTEYLFMEAVRARMTRVQKLSAWFTVRWLPGRVRGSVPKVDPSKPAVVLFTSGSEKAPKAVPLTHANLISEMRAGIKHLEFSPSDVLIGFLPAFHSFGLAVTAMLPLAGGLRLVHHPDPTDAVGLAQKVAAYRPTILAGTPTFVGFILERATPEQMQSLRMIVVGAEKCPASLFEKCRQLAPWAEVLEGYGITECSPVVAVNRIGANRKGTIGQPLPGVEVRGVDLETDEFLPPGRLGMLLVSGPTVFPGYLGHDGPQPFVERDGKRWFVTGDLATIDPDGFITFGGRLKRFLKIGGEMVSLPALEEPFGRKFPPTDKGPRVAVEGVEHDGRRQIVLFTVEPMDLREANALLQAEGFRGVMRLDEVRRVESIPVLGTGKTDYKHLRAQLDGTAGTSGNGAVRTTAGVSAS